MMPLWKVTPGTGPAFHWDGLNTSLTEVVRSSAMGDGATQKTIPLADLGRIQNYITELPAPSFPKSFPGSPKTDAEKELEAKRRATGKQIYGVECASCHDPGGKRFRQVIPITEKDLGTDRYRIEMWTKQAADAYNNHVRDPSWRFTRFQDRDGYVAVPLDGLWLRAPYLHNGSVPTLRDLLNPPERRPKVFWRGYDVYDFKNIGFISTGTKAEEMGIKFDTQRPGNGNGGHLYGTRLNPQQKEALLEYLRNL
jgi:mono/diheme cytochrome c family protein